MKKLYFFRTTLSALDLCRKDNYRHAHKNYSSCQIDFYASAAGLRQLIALDFIRKRKCEIIIYRNFFIIAPGFAYLRL